MSDKRMIGLVVAPGVTEQLGQHLTQDLPDMLMESVDQQITWEIDLVVDPLTGYAESVDDIYQEIANYHDEREWHYIVSITDLPIFYKQHVMALDINTTQGAAIFSYPAFGWRPVKKRFERAMTAVVGEVHHAEQEKRTYDSNHSVRTALNKQFPFSKVNKTSVYLEETGSEHLQYVANSNTMGMARLVSGMTFANNPLNMLVSLSNIVAIAFTTGAFGLIFSTMWQLANHFSMWRLLGISVLAIIGMLIWIMMSHDLWEMQNNNNDKRISWLYNLTTVLTLLIAIAFYYVILYLLFLVAELVLLPSDFLGQQLSLGHDAGIDLYLSIPWFATSISTVAGAIGAGLLNDELIKESTYGYRQQLRYHNSKKK